MTQQTGYEEAHAVQAAPVRERQVQKDPSDEASRNALFPVQSAQASGGMMADYSAGMGASEVQLSALDRALVQFRRNVVQRAGHKDAGTDVHAVAAQGTQGGGGTLPHQTQVQKAFGTHDISGVTAHTGAAADQATQQLGARAYATGSSVVLGKGGSDLHTVAHEAAHVVQQRGGVSLKGGVGQSGDAHEQHADQVADAVVQGKSAQGLLDQYTGGSEGSGVQLAVQFDGLANFHGTATEGEAEASEEGAEEATEDGEMSFMDRLTEAVAAGAEAVGQLAHDVGIDQVTAAMPDVPEALWKLVDYLWPTGTGWNVALSESAKVVVAGTDAGIPCDIEVGEAGALDIWVKRQGKVFTIGVKVKASADGTPKGSVKVAEIGGSLKATMFTSVETAIDLGAVEWPGSALKQLWDNDLSGALHTVLSSCIDLASNTQMTIEGGGDVEGSISQELGADTVLKGLLTEAASIGLNVKMSNATESKNGSLELSEKIGLMIKLEGKSGADELELLGDLPAALGKLVEYLSDASVEGSAEVTLALGLTTPKIGGELFDFEPSLTLGFGNALAGNLGDDSVEVGASASMKFTPAAFFQYVEDLCAGELALPMATVSGDVSLSLDVDDIVAWLPETAKELLGATQGATGVSAAVKLSMEVDSESLKESIEGGADMLATVVDHLRAGRLADALRCYFDHATEAAADILQFMKFEVDLAWKIIDEEVDEHTPGVGDISGGEGKVGVELQATRHFEWESPPDGDSALGEFLRNLL